MTQHVLHTLSNTSSIRLTPFGSHSGLDITIQNVDTNAFVYIGGEGVTALDYGYRISPNQAISFELPSQDSLYAISDINGSKLAVIKTALDIGG